MVMSVSDLLVDARETVLNGVLGVDVDAVLNDAPAPENASPSGAEIAAEIKRAVNVFKATAMADDGHRVDYASLRDSEAYATYRAVCTPWLRRLAPTSLPTREERLAFWINVYNALVIDAVIAFGVEESVTEGTAGVLRFFRRAAYNVGGHWFSAEDIEHGVLRANRGHPYVPGPQFSSSDPRMAWSVYPLDSRIHFALNCASRSCPPIGVYDAGNIDAQLDLAAANFVNAEVEIDSEAGELRLSQIFQWYAGDFGGRAGVIEFLLRHLPESEEREWLASHGSNVRFSYRPYDWTLNTQTV
ncbi:MAG: hypothetical protein MAG451_00268 [Anaerolineales bacterium]|nr:hypothetical protein [Anaerolineales bacterium]